MVVKFLQKVFNFSKKFIWSWTVLEFNIHIFDTRIISWPLYQLYYVKNRVITFLKFYFSTTRLPQGTVENTYSFIN